MILNTLFDLKNRKEQALTLQCAWRQPLVVLRSFEHELLPLGLLQKEKTSKDQNVSRRRIFAYA